MDWIRDGSTPTDNNMVSIDLDDRAEYGVLFLGHWSESCACWHIWQLNSTCQQVKLPESTDGKSCL